MDAQDLSLHDLRAVLMVAEHGHFGRAAAALRLAQPTLSAQVQKVERALGATLFERSARRFLITPDGERLLPLVRELLAAAERLRVGALERGEGKDLPALRLGIIPTLGPYFVPHLLLPLKRSGKRLQLSISEKTTGELIVALREGALDAALLSLPVRSDALESIALFDEPFRLVAPRESDIVGVKRLAPSRMSACDMVLLEDGHCLRDQAIAVCGKRGGVSPLIVTTSLETLKYLVAAGSGYSLLPALACELPRALAELVTLRDFDEKPPSRRIGLCFRKSLANRGQVKELAEFVRQNLPRQVTPVRADANTRMKA
jgi:LysR family hydrogen peroxide-inducible transcriptional activator